MLNSKLSRSALSLILAMLLVFSLTVSVCAEDTLLIAPNPNATGTEVTAESGDASVANDAVADDTANNVTDGETPAETEADAAETEAEHDHDHDHETEATTEEKKEEEKKGMSTFNIISLIILGLLAIVGLIYCLMNREKVGKFLRSLRSELKKISWSTWKDVRKNTLVVIVVVVAIGLLIAGVDFLFSRGILAMKNILS
jgi:preprotein translocase subunit SecE